MKMNLGKILHYKRLKRIFLGLNYKDLRLSRRAASVFAGGGRGYFLERGGSKCTLYIPVILLIYYRINRLMYQYSAAASNKQGHTAAPAQDEGAVTQ